MRRGPLVALYRAFDAALPYVAWSLFVGGLAGIAATGFGWQPPVWVIGLVGWLLVAEAGHEKLSRWVEDEVEGPENSP